MLKPLSESRSVFLLHRHKLHTHSFFGLTPLHDSTRPHLPCGNIKQQLDESAGRRRLTSADVQPTQSKIDHTRDFSFVGGLPGENLPFRRGKARIATMVVHGRHGNSRMDDTLFRFGIEKCLRPRPTSPQRKVFIPIYPNKLPTVPKPSRASRIASLVFSNLPASQSAITRLLNRFRD